MVLAANTDNLSRNPFELVVAGEAEDWLPALGQIVGPRWLHASRVTSGEELLEVVDRGSADAAVIDDACPWDTDVLDLLRVLRQLDDALPVVVVTKHTDRRWLERALVLDAYSVVVKPLEFEEFVRQIYGIMLRLNEALRRGR